MDRWLGKTALVTGAATGIGEAITRALLRNGVNVVAVDIQEEKLADLHAHKSSQRNLGVLHTRHCDISNEQDIERVFKHIEETYDGVDIMVNNAGVSNYNRVIDRALMCSVLGHEIPAKPLSEIIGCNGWNLYPACKHATVALTHTVRRELAAIKSPIRITSISPGIVKTEIAKHSAELQELLDEVPALVPNDVADALIYALATRPEVQITELTIQHTGEF
ncbi:farnesol dehydrogenase isoform X2 [Harpegnathos saltator]|uniref:Dehydrogenase/reductase SDR family member 11 n=1 Tax=Harpegnathos saltator TaxID=610380 RepID=E2BBD7_HARSA|nr:farnesol dehydrogenase isoform X2 [Harpegnathos saltator]EFN86974.1 Dehydrogenase/reductase SDR family member 11 [Harpegnathos saltator]